jgi:ribosomal protein L24
MERHIVQACFGGVVNFPSARRPQILAAFEISNFIPGSVYVEARDPVAVSTAISGLQGVPATPRVDFVPLEERPALLKCHTISKVRKWVRVTRPGKHYGDLGFVTSIDRAEDKATVLLVPRSRLGGKKRRGKRRAWAHPRIFDPRESGLSFQQLEDGGVFFERLTYRGGLVEMIYADHRLRLVTPTAEELDVFDRSQGLEASVMADAWSYCSAMALTPECQVRIVSGEQSGLTGTVLTIAIDICQFLPDTVSTIIDIHLYNLRLHFCVGDYVRVKAGRFAGSVGWVTEVERRVDVDLVTLIDEVSATNREPKEVSISFSPYESITNIAADHIVLFHPRSLRSASAVHFLAPKHPYPRHDIIFECDRSVDHRSTPILRPTGYSRCTR